MATYARPIFLARLDCVDKPSFHFMCTSYSSMQGGEERQCGVSATALASRHGQRMQTFAKLIDAAY